jgi:hypothetical protein
MALERTGEFVEGTGDWVEGGTGECVEGEEEVGSWFISSARRLVPCLGESGEAEGEEGGGVGGVEGWSEKAPPGGVTVAGRAEDAGAEEEEVVEGDLGMSREMSKKGSSVTEVKPQEVHVSSERRVPLKIACTMQLQSEVSSSWGEEELFVRSKWV